MITTEVNVVFKNGEEAFYRLRGLGCKMIREDGFFIFGDELALRESEVLFVRAQYL